MKFDRKLVRITALMLALIAFFAVLLRIFTYWVEIESNTGFFKTEPYACTAYNAVGFLVFGICLIFSMRKKGEEISFAPIREERSEENEESEEETLLDDLSEPREKKIEGAFLNPFSRKTAVWNGTLSAFCTFLPGFGFLAYSLSFMTRGSLATDPYQFIFAILSALSGAAFILLALQNSPRPGNVRPFLALIPSFWCTVRLVVEYRDLARFVNKNLYIGQFLFIISALLFFVYSSQLLFGEKALTSPNAYAFSSLSVLFFGITCRLPQLFAVFGDKVIVDLVDASSLFIDLAITLYVGVKLWSVLRRENTHF